MMFKKAIKSSYIMNQSGETVEVITEGRYYQVLQDIGDFITFKGNKGITAEFYADENVNNNQYEYFEDEIYTKNIPVHISHIAEIVEEQYGTKVKWVEADVIEEGQVMPYKALFLVEDTLTFEETPFVKIINDEDGELKDLEVSIKDYYVFNWDSEIVDNCFVADGVRNGILVFENPNTGEHLPHSELVNLVLGHYVIDKY